ncbi:isotrichodermin C-15 hydroxylase [Cadophora sp. MPI-SDFR-AT-0126]|nr:isotrichodermin C-15 hydroxylase [Leotiomycetes sp. MPI-SDFR-AT-0126]
MMDINASVIVSSMERINHYFAANYREISPLRLFFTAVILLGAIVLIGAVNLVYQRYFSPLSHIPGPWWAGSTFLYCRLLSDGTFNKKVQELHEKYGDVVRVAPREVSFICGEVAWDEIYGFRAGSKKSETFLKDRYWIAKVDPPSMIAADGADHTRFRRLLSHAFSNKALKDQEPLIQASMDLFIDGLKKEVQVRSDGVVDLVKWFNRLTLDVIGDLTFGKSFDCLTKGNDQFVEMVDNMLHAGAQGRVRHLQPMLGTLSTMLGLEMVPVSALKTIPQFIKFSRDAVDERLNSEVDRPDFISQIVQYNDVKGKGMTRDELDSNCIQFLIAGSETSATALSGITYLLCTNSVYMEKLKKEIRHRFSGYKDLTFDALDDIPLDAVINEGLRIYPPVPTGFPRLVPSGGATIGEYYIPAKTSVYMSQFAANQCGRNFVNPKNFFPERWMGDPDSHKDKKKVYQPFSYGPRGCIGKNLAYAEMRVALARLLFHFDLELQANVDDWLDQKVWVTWNKKPLLVKLRLVET